MSNSKIKIDIQSQRIKELEDGILELLCNFSECLPYHVIEGLQKLLGKEK